VESVRIVMTSGGDPVEPAAQSLKVKLLYLEAKREAKGLENSFESAMRKR
jgi:hypothetical protein